MGNTQDISLSEKEYFSHIRHDIIKYVSDPGISTILSVGCANGYTEKVLIEQYRKTVYGIEYSKDAAEVAARNGVLIVGNDANKIDPSNIKMVFDCIIFADVLEHLYDPLSVIKQCMTLLKKGGKVCISVPNFRHYSVLNALFFKGVIQYCDGGIFDKTHLRITTRKMVLGWLDACNLKLQAVEYIFWGRRNKYLSLLFLGLFKDFIAHQIVLIGERR